MAFITEQAGPISRIAAPLLSRNLVLPATVTRIPRTDFSGPSGDTVNVRVPQPTDSNEQAAGGGALTPSTIDEVSVAIAVAHVYNLQNLDEYELNLEIEDFAAQVTALQVEAVARGTENKLATVMNGLAADASFALSASAADTKAQLQAAREFLTNNDAPSGNRWFAAAPDIITRILNVDEFVRADALGDGRSTALREARAGSIYGMNVIESNALTAGTAVAYHSSGFALAAFAPQNPQGATSSASMSVNGIALRSLFQYNAANAVEQALVSVFAGAAAVWEDGDTATENKRFYKLDTATT